MAIEEYQNENMDPMEPGTDYEVPLGELVDPALTHFDNLVDLISEDQANTIASQLYSEFEIDKSDHEEHMEKIEEGLACFGMDGGVSGDPDSDDDLNMVKHVILEEAVTHGHGRLVAEINPAEGPIKFKLEAEANEELEMLQERATKFMNWQLKHKVKGWNQIIDKAFLHMVIGGTMALKITWDMVRNCPDIEFVPVKNLIPSADTDSLATSKRYTHRYFLTVNEYLTNVDYGVFARVPEVGNNAGDVDGQGVGAEIEGTSVSDNETSDSKKMLTFLDIFTYASFDDIDQFPEGSEQIQSPYVITIDEGTRKVVSIRRNWNYGDETREPIQSIYEFRFFPALKFWGFGFYDKIGGLDKAATAALRDNLRAAALSLNPPKIISGSGLPSGRIKLGPGMVIQSKRSSAEDITKNIHEIPVMSPDATTLALSADMVENARKFSNTTDFMVGDLGKAGTPAATTLALIEQGQQAQTAIHKRVHEDLAPFFKEMQRLNFLYLAQENPFTVNGVSQIVFNTDFDPNTIDIIPYSDPNVSSDTQRIMQMDALIQLGMSLQGQNILLLKPLVLQYMKAIKVPNPERFMAPEMEPVFQDAGTENALIMSGESVMVHPDDDDAGHILAHMAFLNDPSLANNQVAGDEVKFPLIIHIRQQIAQYYKKYVSAAIGIPIGQPTDPQTTAIIQMRVTELMQASPVIHSLDALAMGTGDEAFDMTVEIAKLDYQIKQMEMKDEMDARQQKMIDDSMARKDKMMADRQAIIMRAETEASLERQNHMLKIQNMETQFTMREQASNEQARNKEAQKWQETIEKLKMEWQKHEQELKEEWEKHRLEMRAEIEKLQAEKEKLAIEKEKLQASAEAAKKKSFWGGGKSE